MSGVVVAALLLASAAARWDTTRRGFPSAIRVSSVSNFHTLTCLSVAPAHA